MISEVIDNKIGINLGIPFTEDNVKLLLSRIHCEGCGDCCREGEIGIIVSPEEVERLAFLAKVSKKKFKESYTITDNGHRCLKYPCIFYDDNTKRCKIYYDRPLVCRLYPFNQTQKVNGIPLIVIHGGCKEGHRVPRNIIELDITEGLAPDDQKALGYLANQAAKPSAMLAEIGSWKGHSAYIISKEIKEKGGHLYCIDHWKGNIGTKNIEEIAEKNIYELFEHNMVTLGVRDYITPMIMDSMTAVGEFVDGSIDFLFIDADHRYTPFMDDLTHWYPKIKKGGIICGHDCETKYSWEIKEVKDRIDNHLEMDFDRTYHCGVIKGLYDYFNDDYTLMKDSKIWMKTK